MRAAVASAGSVHVEDVADPVPGPGQVLVAPLACGICGSDLHLLDTQAATPDFVPPMVLGHEFVGEIVDFGPDTDRTLRRGAIVTSVPYIDRPGGTELVGLSTVATGALAERVVLQEHRLLLVPDGVPPEHAALTEPLAVGVHAVAAADLMPGDVALVIGCGPVGLSVLAALKAAGRGPIVAADFSAGRRSLAEKLGADIVIDPAEHSPYTAWSDLAGPGLPPSPLITGTQRPNTVVFECVGMPGILNTVTESVLPHTRIFVVGVCLQPDTILPAVAITKELSLRFIFAYRPEEFARALQRIADGSVDPLAFITATLPLDQAPTAFTELRKPDHHCKILITPTP